MTADEVRALANELDKAHLMSGHYQLKTISTGVHALRDYADLLDRQAEMERYTDALEDRVAASRVALERERARCAPLVEALEAAEAALRTNMATWLTLEPILQTTYPDDPRWTPWTRFGKRAWRAASVAHQQVRDALTRSVWKLAEDVPALCDEVERLRAALEHIARLTPDEAPTPLIMATMARDIARAALEDKEPPA